ncbi:hypothetical protein [Modestobacter sp. NPDC049651]|uniref:hypothetical protein n=1 Tax=unclassified Modestobacter TaxID=2643866 RepID=UPI0033EEFBCE
MTSALATLRLEPALHTHDVMDGRVARHPQSHFLDFLISGVSLQMTAHGVGNLVTELNRLWWSPDSLAVETLLGRRPAPCLESGRIPLLVCGECGDLACGAVTAALDMGAREVTWSEFRWENGYEEPEPMDSLGVPITFDRGQYEAELADADHRVVALRENEPLFRGRSRRRRQLRWPWQPRTT